jgi:hypothetical protein
LHGIWSPVEASGSKVLNAAGFGVSTIHSKGYRISIREQNHLSSFLFRMLPVTTSCIKTAYMDSQAAMKYEGVRNSLD